MKLQKLFHPISIVILLSTIFFLAACKKDAATTPVVTVPTAPKATTSSATWINHTWATMNGIINANSDFTNISFEYGKSDAYGLTKSSVPDTASGNLNINIYSNLTGLDGNTTYHFRVKAVNSIGTTYGADSTFTTWGPPVSNITFNPDLTYGSVSDIEGNTYKTIVIGIQTWMAENLKTTKYNDNTSIPLVTKSTTWVSLSDPGYCWYNNDSLSYGALYNWYTVNTGKLCPSGWHVPSETDWSLLISYLGGESLAGNKLKETGSIHWLNQNTSATNESGFTAIPGGYLTYGSTFSNIRKESCWWSSTEYTTLEAYFRDLYYSYSNVDNGSSSKKSGLSVRCIMNL
jgi:uncharacterized protein (TIGR02145 family)